VCILYAYFFWVSFIRYGSLAETQNVLEEAKRLRVEDTETWRAGVKAEEEVYVFFDFCVLDVLFTISSWR